VNPLTSPPEQPLARHWIDGDWVESGARGDSIDPATGTVIGQYVKAGAEEAERAISVATRVFDQSSWRFDRDLRARVLNSMADLFEARSQELVEILALENGKIKPEAGFEVSMAGPAIRFDAALALIDTGRAAQVEQGALTVVVHQAAGVAGIIAPWNSPVALVLRSLAPALAAGAATMINLPVATAQTNALIAEIISQTPGLPAGVVNVLIGGHDSADALVRSAHVPVISFTGSTKTGKVISVAAAPNLKRLGLELGGKAPMIVFDDADLDVAIPKIMRALTVSGQFCMTGSRLLVQSAWQRRCGPGSPTGSSGCASARPANGRHHRPEERLAHRRDGDRRHRRGRARYRTGWTGHPRRPGQRRVLPADPSRGDRPGAAHRAGGSVRAGAHDVGVRRRGRGRHACQRQPVRAERQRVLHRCRPPAARCLQLQCGTVWMNDWAVLHNQSEEGGFKGSGQGRMRGLTVIDDFIKYKHIAFAPGITGTQK
jgi:betaine-aldehyde dehydrogenase